MASIEVPIMDNTDSLKTKNQDLLLEEWHDKFINKRKEHLQIAQRYNVAYWIFGIINVILSAFGSIFSAVNGADTFMGADSNFVNASIHFLVLIITGVQHFSHFQNRELSHLKVSHQYAELTKLIEYQQTLEKSERNVKEILERYDSIVEKEPLITNCC